MIRAGMVGLGWWGKRLLEAAGPAGEHIRFVHAVSPRPDLRRDVAEAHGLRLSPTIAAMLRDPAVEAVVLATPHSMHADQIVELARGGKPILCEKPFTLKRADAVRAVAACEQAGVLLALGHNRRFLPALAELKHLIAAGTLGRLLHVEGHISNQNSANTFAAWRHDAEESPAGGLTGTGVHMLDCFVNLLGPVRRVTTQLLTWQAPPEALDSLSVLLEFHNGMSGTLATVRVAGDLAAARVRHRRQRGEPRPDRAGRAPDRQADRAAQPARGGHAAAGAGSLRRCRGRPRALPDPV